MKQELPNPFGVLLYILPLFVVVLFLMMWEQEPTLRNNVLVISGIILVGLSVYFLNSYLGKRKRRNDPLNLRDKL